MRHVTTAGMLGVLMLLALGSLPALGGEREGTLPDELAAQKPPAPNETYVAVLRRLAVGLWRRWCGRPIPRCGEIRSGIHWRGWRRRMRRAWVGRSERTG